MELELRHLFRVARRWWWLLLLTPLLVGATARYVSTQRLPLYSASANLFIYPADGVDGSNSDTISAAQGLATTYQQMIQMWPILAPVIDELALPYDVRQLQEKVSASVVRDTQLLRVTVSDPDPQLAADIANAVARHFADYIALQAVQLSSSSREALDQQIVETKGRIDDTARQIQELEQGPDAAAPAVQAQLDPLRGTLNQLQQAYSDLLLTAQAMDLNAAAAKLQVTVAEPALTPLTPYAPRVTLTTVLGLFAGLLIATGAVFLLEYLDNTVKVRSDFAALVGGPLLSVVGTVSKLRAGRDLLFVVDHPKASASESVRLLRTNIEFAAATRKIQSLAITSAGPAEGKSTVTANLAVAMTQAGLSVAIIDADLRRPSQHRIFNVKNERGLTTLLTHPNLPWRGAAIEGVLPNLTLIPSGPLPPNPADLLSLDRFKQLLEEIDEAVDIVLIDTPPSLAASDSLVIATHTDGVLLVCHAGRTRIEALRRTASAFQQGAIRIVGVVLNRQSGREAADYYYAYYYGPTDPSPGGAATAAPAASGTSQLEG